MKKMLFIGCGGSGGMTLRYLMDQVSADMKAAGAPGRVPLPWQFVHIDAPAQEEDLGDGGFRTVTEYNDGSRHVGSYISMGTTLNYEEAASTLTTRLHHYADRQGSENVRNMAMDMASWQPNNQAEMRNLNSTSLSDGAGEFRMIGRVLFLNALDKIVKGLQDANGRTKTNAAQADAQTVEKFLPELSVDPNNENADKTMVFVFGSMAGGSGASMLIDVARAVQLAVPNNQTVIYGYAPEIFQNLAIGVTPGHAGNALAMASEISALLITPDSAANKRDAELFRALGHSTPESESTFDRFFPIGLSQGSTAKITHRDADPGTIYRRLGRGIARLVMSSSAFDTFTRYTLGNTAGGSVLETNRKLMNWGASSPAAAWSGFGYASLAMGRDRFREYAAQRLARNAVDVLTEGHLDPTSVESGKAQLQRLVDNDFEGFIAGLGLPSLAQEAQFGQGSSMASQAVITWLEQTYGSTWNDQLQAHTTEAMMRLLPAHNPADDSVANVTNWLAQLQQVTYSQRQAFEQLEQHTEENIRQMLIPAMNDLVARVQQSIEEAVARYGLEYASAMVARLRNPYLDYLARNLETLGSTSHASARIADATNHLYQEVDSKIRNQARRAKSVGGLGQEIEQARQRHISSGVYRYANHVISRILSGVLIDFSDNFLNPLALQLNDRLSLLSSDKHITQEASGVELYHTEVYGHWPSGDRVPQRFKAAHNEVLLTAPESFPAHYEQCLRNQYQDDLRVSAEEGERRFTEAIITGRWPIVSGRRSPADQDDPKNLIVMTQAWIPGGLADRRRNEIATAAKFTIHSNTGDVLDRALQYLDRPNEAFDQFVSQDISSYGTDESAPEAELRTRQDELANKFLEAASMAQPMVSVSPDVASALHPSVENIVRTLTFAKVPFANQEAGKKVFESLGRQRDLSDSSKAQFERQMRSSDKGEGIRRVDIFGSFQNYMPVVYSSIFRPIYEYWTSSHANRPQFTNGRRTRSLTGFIPVSDVDRQAMIAGWLLGEILGLVRFSDQRNATPAEIYDADQRRWLRFPWPMYTTPQDFKDKFGRDSWLPAVLESIPLAWLNWYSSDHNVITNRDEQPLRAYQVLRELYDSGDTPTEQDRFLAANDHLQQALHQGTAVTGEPVALLEKATTPQERHELLVGALDKLIEDYTALFLTPQTQFQRVKELKHIYQVPLVADLADDIVLMARTLQDLSQRALEAASANDSPFGYVDNDRGLDF